MIDAFLLIFAGIVGGLTASGPVAIAQMCATNNGILAVISSLRCFGPETAIFRREMHSGISSFSYFFGKITAQLPVTLINPLFFLATFYRLCNPEVDFIYLYLILVCLNLRGYVLSLTMPQKSAQLAAVVCGLIALMCGGVTPTLRSLMSSVAGNSMVYLTYGPFTMGSILLAGLLSDKTFKAELPARTQFMYDRGYIDTIDGQNMLSDEDIDNARQKLLTRSVQLACTMLFQYIVFVFLSFLLIWFFARAENGGFLKSMGQVSERSERAFGRRELN